MEIRNQISNDDFFNSYADSQFYSNDMQEKMKLLKAMNKCEKMEITSLLELALWKVSIVFSNMAELREYSILEHGRNSENFDDVIMTHF